MAQSRQSLNTLLTEPAAPVSCPSDDDLLAFALGKLNPEFVPDIETHLDDCGTCQRVLSEAAHALAAAVTSPLIEISAGDWNTTFQRGALVDNRYVIQRFITRGGMGEVYEAFDRNLSQRVALKTVTSTAGDNDRAVRRLKAEVQLARLVSHPNVCRIYDLGTHRLPGAGGEVHFLTMEFVEGETLGQRVRLVGALPFPEAKKVTRDLLLGLRAAHDAGVLHRDFKSDNVMLRSGTGSRAVVLDFGLARAVGRDESSANHSNLVGTFGYIAPEQLEGKPHTCASDLYAFGVVWFELLTGQLPFGDEPSSTSRVRKRFRGEVPPPSRVNPELPPELDALVLRCLERSPKRRFQDVEELLAALDALDAPRRRLRPRLIAGVCAGSLVLAGTGWVLYAPTPPGASPLTDPELRDRAAHTPEKPSAPPNVLAEALTPEQRDVLTPAAGVAAPRARESARPARSPLVRTAQSPPRVTPGSAELGGGQPEPTDRHEPLVPAEPRDPTAISPGTPPAVGPPIPSSPPAVEPARVRKPDWENPFGAIQPAALWATAT